MDREGRTTLALDEVSRPQLAFAAALSVALLLLAACQRAAPRLPDAGPPIRAAAPAPPAPPPPRGKQLTIVYSSNLLGEYEPCG